jgi:hypothetical protein
MKDITKVIIFFLLLIIVLPFYESKRVIMWDSPRGEKVFNVFHGFVLVYAQEAESIKTHLGFNKKTPTINSPGPFVATTSAALGLQPTSTDLQLSATTISHTQITFSPASSPYRFLLVGDSFMAVMGGVGDILEGSLIKFKEAAVLRVGRVSSGLSRPDYFDWPNQVRQLIANNQPNIVVIMMGTNDAQSFEMMSPEGQREIFKYGTQKWEEEYRRRVREFLNIFQENHILVYWIGLPIMKDPVYSEKIKGLDLIYEQEILNFSNARFIPTWSLLADQNGNYASSLLDIKGRQMATRVSDGIHLTTFAGELVVEHVLKIIKEAIALELKK